MLLLFLVFALTLGPQVVLSDGFKFSFSEVQQCEPLSLFFKGELEPGDPVPVTLTVLPFNGTAVSIPVPSGAINSTGLNVTFLPFAQGTNFIASLDDSTGDNAAKVSDIVRVTPSDNTSCSLQTKEEFVPSFTVLDPVSQCESFRVRYSNSKAPNVRLFFPNLGSFPLNLISDDPQTKTATFIMTAPRQSQVVLMLNDTVVAETTALLPVTGDTSSSKSCFPRQNNMMPGNSQPSQASKPGLSKSVAIGLGVGFGILLLLAIPMIGYVIRERRMNRRAMRKNDRAYAEKSSFDNEKKGDWSDGPYQVHNIQTLPTQPTQATLPPAPPRPPAPPPFFSYNTVERRQQTRSWEDNGYVVDPAYVSDSYSPTISDFARSSIFWEMVTTADDQSGDHRESAGSQRSRRSQRNTNPLLPSSKDLEHMLDVAAMSRNNSSVSVRSSKSSRASRPWGSESIEIPTAIPTRNRSRTGSGNMTISASALNPIQPIPRDVSTFLADTSVDDRGNPIFYESPMSMDSHLRNGSQGSIAFENPGRVGSRSSAITTSSDDSVGQILRAHPTRPEESPSNNSLIGAEDGHGLGSDSTFRFTQSSHYSPSPLAKASRQSNGSMGELGK